MRREADRVGVETAKSVQRVTRRLSRVDDHDAAPAVHARDELAKVRRHGTDHVVHRRHDHDGVPHRLGIDEHAGVVVSLHDDARDAGAPRGRDRREEHGGVLGDGRDDAREAPGRQCRQQQVESVRRVQCEGARVVARRHPQGGQDPLSDPCHLGIHPAPRVVAHTPSAGVEALVVVLDGVDHRLRSQRLAGGVEVDLVGAQILEARSAAGCGRRRAGRAVGMPAEQPSSGRSARGIHSAIVVGPLGSASGLRP